MLAKSITPKTYIIAILYCSILAIVSSPFISKEILESESLLDTFYHNPDRSLNTCVLKWDVDSINGKNDLGITEAPILYPYRHTKFYAEHLFGQLIFAWPLSFVIDSPYWLYIFIYELNRILTGFAAFLLVLQLTSMPLASIVAGGLMISGWQMAQLQNTSLGFVLLAFVFLIKHDRTLRWRDAFGIYVFLALSGLSSGYFAFYAPVAILIVLIGHTLYHRSIPSRIWFLQIGTVILLTIVSLLPTMYIYKEVQVESGLRRPGYVVRKLVPSFFGETLEEPDDKEEVIQKRQYRPKRLSGIACLQILLFGYALLLLIQRKLNSQGWVVGFCLLAVLSLWMAMYKSSPYALLWHLPGFNGLRAAHRWSLFFGFAVTAVNGVTIAYFLLHRPRAAKTTLGIILGLLVAVSALGRDTIRTHPLPQSHVYQFLQTIPAGPIFIGPLPRTEKIYTTLTSARMLYQLSHYKPMVLGYSGFVPTLSRLIKITVIHQGVNDHVVQRLATAGVRYIIIDNLAIDAHKDKDFLRSSELVHVIYDQNDELVAEVNKVPVEKDIKKLIQMWKKKKDDYLE
jgi:hypothetical protein